MSKTAASHVIPLGLCPYCGHAFDRAGQGNQGRQPQADDLSVCIDCANVSIFTADLRHRKPSEAELLQAFRVNPDLAVSVARLRRTVEMVNKDHKKPRPRPN